MEALFTSSLSTGLRVGLWGLLSFPFLLFLSLSFSNRTMARFRRRVSSKLRIVQPAPQSLPDRQSQPSSLTWKIAQACCRSQVDNRVAQRPGRGEERPPLTMPPTQIMGSDRRPGQPREGPSFYGWGNGDWDGGSEKPKITQLIRARARPPRNQVLSSPPPSGHLHAAMRRPQKITPFLWVGALPSRIFSKHRYYD